MIANEQEVVLIFIVIGVLGIVLAGLLSKFYFNKADPLERLEGSVKGRAFGGVVPVWVSWFYLAAFGCLLYGIYQLLH